MEEEKWLKWAIELQSLAQIGLTYARDAYDQERYQRIREISAEILAHKADMPVDKVRDLFCNEVGYQTPKLDSRAVIVRDQKILLVLEKNGKWSLPGGWVDVDLSIKENTIKEVKEEAGLDVSADRILAVQDRAKHNQPVYPYGVCKVFVQCTVLGGRFEDNLETLAYDYFSLDELPILDTAKNTREQINMCIEAARDPDWQPIFD